MPTNPQHLRCIPETPLTHVQPVYLLPATYRLLGVEGGVPGFDVQAAEYDIGDVGWEVCPYGCTLGRGCEDRGGGGEGGGGHCCGGEMFGDEKGEGAVNLKREVEGRRVEFELGPLL